MGAAAPPPTDEAIAGLQLQNVQQIVFLDPDLHDPSDTHEPHRRQAAQADGVCLMIAPAADEQHEEGDDEEHGDAQEDNHEEECDAQEDNGEEEGDAQDTIAEK